MHAADSWRDRFIGLCRAVCMRRDCSQRQSLDGEEFTVVTGRLAYPLRDQGDTSWMQRGLCAGLEPSLMFPETGDGMKRAKIVCSACPVADACLDYALRNGEMWGCWGGKTERERRRLRSEMRRRGELPRTHTLKSPIEHGSGTAAYTRCRKANGEACARCKAGHAAAVQAYKETIGRRRQAAS